MARARWLNDEEQEAWRTYLFATRLLNASLDRQLQRDAGMPHTYYVILAMLSEATNRTLTMSQIADLTRSSPSKLSHAMNRLEENGWVRRCRDPHNARSILATLTDDGLDTVVELAPKHVAHVRAALFDALSAEQVRQMRDIFNAVLIKLEDDESDCPSLAPSQQTASA